MNRFVVGAVLAALVLTLGACRGRTVDEELLPTRVATLAPDAFAVTPLPEPTATPVPTQAPTEVPVEVPAEVPTEAPAAADTSAAEALTATGEITATAEVTAEVTAEAVAETGSTPTEGAAATAAEEITATETVTATDEVTSGEAITGEAEAAGTPSLLPTATSTPVATAEATEVPTVTAEPTVEPTAAPEATATEAPTTAAPADAGAAGTGEVPTELPAGVQAALENADPTRGQSLTLSNACIGCHSVDPNQMMVGPTWYNLAETAATRVEGQSAEVYLYNSIIHPNDYVVQGYLAGIMLQTYGSLSDQDLADLVAYLLTLKAE